MGRDDESSWARQLLVGIGVLAAVSLLVGAVVGLVALGAADVAGIGPADHVASQRPSLYMPTEVPTTRPEVYPPAKRLTPPSQPSASPSVTSAAKAKRHKQITLQGFPSRVSPGQRIDLTGLYQGGEGAVLQVQRLEGGRWSDFPVTTTVSGGIFSTYVTTSRTGLTRFRVVERATGRHSNPVQITVG